MGGAFTDAAVGNSWLGWVEILGALVELGEFGEGFKCAVFGVDGFGPWDGLCAGDMSASEGPFVGVVGHVGAGTGEFFGRTDVYELALLFDMGDDFVAKGADLGVIAFGSGVGGVVGEGGFGGEGALFVDPFEPAAIHDAAVGVSEEVKHPEGVASPPVVFVAVKDDV